MIPTMKNKEFYIKSTSGMKNPFIIGQFTLHFSIEPMIHHC